MEIVNKCIEILKNGSVYYAKRFSEGWEDNKDRGYPRWPVTVKYEGYISVYGLFI